MLLLDSAADISRNGGALAIGHLLFLIIKLFYLHDSLRHFEVGSSFRPGGHLWALHPIKLGRNRPLQRFLILGHDDLAFVEDSLESIFVSDLGLHLLHIQHFSFRVGNCRQSAAPQSNSWKAGVTNLLDFIRHRLSLFAWEIAATARHWLLVEGVRPLLCRAVQDWSWTCLDHGGVQLSHKVVAQAAHLRPIIDDCWVFVPCHDLVLSRLLEVSIVPCLVRSKANWNCTYAAHLGKIGGSIIKVVYLPFSVSLLLRFFYWLLFVGIPWTQHVGVLRNIWNFRDGIKVSLLPLLFSLRPCVEIRFLPIVNGSMDFMVLLVEI